MKLFAFRRRRGARGRNQRGLTLVEVLVAVLLFAISITVLIGSTLYGYRILKVNTHKTAALSVAREKIENLMNLKFNSLSTSPGQYNEQDVVIDSASGLAADVTVVVTSMDSKRKQIVVTVAWIDQARNYQVRLSTLSTKHNVT